MSGPAVEPDVQVVILAAGMGTRLGREHPKPLTVLRDGRTILRRQLDHVRAAFGDRARVHVVVGFKKELVTGAARGEAVFVTNDGYARSNTSKSLLAGLRACGPGGVLWMNGDVVFVPGLLEHLREAMSGGTFVAVNTARVAEEEVKYLLDERGYVAALSKEVAGGLGEAVGINWVDGRDRPVLERELERVDPQDYFEKALEGAISAVGLRVRAVDVSRFGVVEVDVDDDLDRANDLVPVPVPVPEPEQVGAGAGADGGNAPAPW